MNNEEIVEETPVVDAETVIEDVQIAEAIEERHAEDAGVTDEAATVPFISVETIMQTYIKNLYYIADKLADVNRGSPAFTNALGKLRQAIKEFDSDSNR